MAFSGAALLASSVTALVMGRVVIGVIGVVTLVLVSKIALDGLLRNDDS